MSNTKRNFIILTVISTVFSLLGVLLYKFFPRMKQYCEEMKAKCWPEAECCPEEPEPKKKRTRKKK